MRSLWVGAAGFAGAVARYSVDALVGRQARGATFGEQGEEHAQQEAAAQV